MRAVQKKNQGLVGNTDSPAKRLRDGVTNGKNQERGCVYVCVSGFVNDGT